MLRCVHAMAIGSSNRKLSVRNFGSQTRTGYFEGRGNWGKDDKVLAASGIRALPCLPRRTEENPPQTAELGNCIYRANTTCHEPKQSKYLLSWTKDGGEEHEGGGGVHLGGEEGKRAAGGGGRG